MRNSLKGSYTIDTIQNLSAKHYNVLFKKYWTSYIFWFSFQRRLLRPVKWTCGKLNFSFLDFLNNWHFVFKMMNLSELNVYVIGNCLNSTALYDEKYNTKVWRPSTYNLDSIIHFVVIIFVILTLFGHNNERISYYSVRFFQSNFFWKQKFTFIPHINKQFTWLLETRCVCWVWCLHGHQGFPSSSRQTYGSL